MSDGPPRPAGSALPGAGGPSFSSPPRAAPEEFRAFAQHIHRLTGIALDDSKAYLLESRLGPLRRELGCATFSELLYRIRGDATRRLERVLVDAITTNETLFFRDEAPFELLRHKLVPEIIDRRAGRPGPIPIRIWSAACSTGQEVYSLAMMLVELLGASDRYQIRILGTDISDAAVAAASRGVFSRLEVERGLSPDRLLRHFVPQGDGTWRVRDELRAMATFRTWNLTQDLGPLGRFDLILCRNVAIYFDEPTRKSLFDRMERVLEPDGALVIGATESLSGLCPQYASHRHLRSVFYRPQRPGLGSTGPKPW